MHCHAWRVAHLAALTARELGYKRSDLQEIILGALFHDVGKLEVPPAILRSSVSGGENALLRQHPRLGIELLETCGLGKKFPLVPLLIVYQHHERWNGQGFPDGLRGEQIHPCAHIVAAADAFDVLAYGRAKQKGLGPERAVARLESGSGDEFAQEIVGALTEIIRIASSSKAGEGS